MRSARVRRTRRRGLVIVEATVADESGPAKAVWFNQAWLAERLGAGTRLLLYGKLDRSGFRVEAHEFLPAGSGTAQVARTGAPRPGPPHDRHRPGPSRVGAAARPAAARVGVAGEAAGPPRARAAAGGASRPPPPGGRRRFAGRRPFSGQPRRGRAGSGSARLRGALPAPGGARRAPPRAVRRAGRASPWASPAKRSRAGWRRCPSSSRAISGARSTRSTPSLDSERPMQRLLMGEVGSGKTVVAAYAMLRAVEAGFQAALMAPTETLAEQHAATLDRLLADHAGPVHAADQRDAGGAAPRGAWPPRLGRARDGGRDARADRARRRLRPARGLRGRRAASLRRPPARPRSTPRAPEGAAPHALHMTATPIPRTLSLTAYGDLDATVLRELPAGRQPVETWVVGEEKRAGAYEFIRERLREGRQAYVVCPLVEGSEKLEAKAAAEEADRLRAGEFADFEVGLLHGQMPSREKQAAMERFAAGRTDVLVATSVIEVGIDVANATVIVVEGAERYGLSQLHQLRGRVGRGEHASHCILFADAGLGARPPPPGGDRGRAGRLQAGGGRPGAARRGGDPGHPAARPAALPRGGASRGRRGAHRGAARADRAARSVRVARRARAGAVAPGRPGALRRRARRADRGLDEGRGRRAQGTPPGGAATALGGGSADRGPRSRGAVRDPRGGRRGERPRPVLRHRGARHRGPLPGGRPGDPGRHPGLPRPAQRARARPGGPRGGRPLRRASLPATLPPALRPDLLRPAL